MKMPKKDTLMMEEDVHLDLDLKEKYTQIVLQTKVLTMLLPGKNGVTLIQIKGLVRITRTGVIARKSLISIKSE